MGSKFYVIHSFFLEGCEVLAKLIWHRVEQLDLGRDSAPIIAMELDTDGRVNPVIPVWIIGLSLDISIGDVIILEISALEQALADSQDAHGEEEQANANDSERMCENFKHVCSS